MFGQTYDESNTICETRVVDLSQYKNVPVHKVVNVVGAALNASYALLGFYLVGSALVVKIKKKLKEKKQGRTSK